MRSVRKDHTTALAAFQQTYDLRRAVWQEHRRRLRLVREQERVRQQRETDDHGGQIADMPAVSEVSLPDAGGCQQTALMAGIVPVCGGGHGRAL